MELTRLQDWKVRTVAAPDCQGFQVVGVNLPLPREGPQEAAFSLRG